MNRDELKQQAKNYISSIYLSHRNDELENLYNFIDVIFSYVDIKVDETIKEHEDKKIH